MESHTKASHWYLLTGLLIGLTLGLLVSIFVVPVENAEALPNELSETGRANYRAMIALAYSSNQDLERAITRLELLGEQNPVDLMIAQAQSLLANGGSETTARALAALATRLSQYLPPVP
ncbi:MAG: hypothetical protein M0P11_02635 [Anaerolineaceae bacterium]|nr:hypothetical protein [Anaerolineaceae bacterium]